MNNSFAAQQSTLDKIRQAVSLCNSYTRMPTLIQEYPESVGDILSWFTVLGEEWSCCDNIGEYAPELRAIFKTADQRYLAAMMTAEEQATLSGLPDMITVYRGCYAINSDGLSWSLCRDTALGFTSLHRYHRPGETPLLITGRVPRQTCVLKLDRNEQEVISADVCVVAVGRGGDE